ncbi:uncharacterized protein LOC126894023 [Daktulosphaira vitifoliae]|uniref:uncharacterized protein LOC126894023 n=1 Tax=Daktulosphaira vitifoliae TaxID=58002 RepID=UPI0021AA61F2|nr:uncharacterized protein LOC126894023 [Daktulosphaira vitifoliae]XP_050520607.1 uncharacterized protein LOC126894023 [Daktulosphaira vitifoliae]XP_050520608.1 uncharacterized protein LOC126894023 [Daktulosphaira vitifoliae]
MKIDLALALIVALFAIASARPQDLSLVLMPPLQFDQPLLNNAIIPPPNVFGKPINPIVVAAFQRDSLLPANMQNSFYKNPRIAESLAKNSWFGPGEQHAVDRDTEKIPREQIFHILKNAGLLPTSR